jgi:hypothetical protein
MLAGMCDFTEEVSFVSELSVFLGSTTTSGGGLTLSASYASASSRSMRKTSSVRNWPPAFKEWNTKSVRDAFFASPQFPRLLDPHSIKDTIARGVENGMLGYVGKKADGKYEPFHWKSSLLSQDVEISDDVFLIERELAEAYEAGRVSPPPDVVVEPRKTDNSDTNDTSSVKPHIPASIPRLVWSGDVPHQKWMNFYTKVLSKFAATAGLKLTLRVEVAPAEGVSPQKVDETKVALRELGLKDSLEGE